MTPEDKLFLDRLLKLSEENNRILKRLRRSQRFSTFWSFVQFCIIVVPIVVGYVYLQPYLGSLGDMFTKAESIIQTGYTQINTPR